MVLVVVPTISRKSKYKNTYSTERAHETVTESLLAVLQIYDILVWIRIRGSMPLTNGSGSGFGAGSYNTAF
jgi:hypothetical protein